MLFAKNWPIREIPNFGQNVKCKVTPFAFLKKLADSRNTDSWAKCKVNPFTFLQKLADFGNTDFWAKVRLTPLHFCKNWPIWEIPIFGQKKG